MCDQCQVVRINGTATHELGCPNAWKHPVTDRPYLVECFECGCEFEPEERGDRLCDGCRAPAIAGYIGEWVDDWDDDDDIGGEG